jgi:hypothetical protein
MAMYVPVIAAIRCCHLPVALSEVITHELIFEFRDTRLKPGVTETKSTFHLEHTLRKSSL